MLRSLHAAAVFVALALLWCAPAAWAVDPQRHHALGGVWGPHRAMGTWSIYDGPGREDGLLFVQGGSDASLWIAHLIPNSNDRWTWAVDFEKRLEGPVVNAANVLNDYFLAGGPGQCPDNVPSMLCSTQIQIKSFLDNRYALPGTYKFRISPGTDWSGTGSFDFRYAPLNGDIQVTVMNANTGGPIPGAQLVYNANRTNFIDSVPQCYWITEIANGSGVARITRGVSVERTLTVSAPYYGTANVLVVGGEGPRASRYTVVLWPGGGNAPLLQNNGMEPTATGVVTSDSADTYVPEPSGGGGGTPPTCPAGQHYDTATSACVADSSGGSGSGGPSDPSFWTKEFWIDILKQAFVPPAPALADLHDGWDALAHWGPFGAVTSIFASWNAAAVNGGINQAPVFRITFGFIPRPDGVPPHQFVLDLRPRTDAWDKLGCFEQYSPEECGSNAGTILAQWRPWIGRFTTFFWVLGLARMLRPRLHF